MEEFKILEAEGIATKKTEHEANMANKTHPESEIPNVTHSAIVEETPEKAKADPHANP